MIKAEASAALAPRGLGESLAFDLPLAKAARLART